MNTHVPKLNRPGISLTEVLIGIMVLGIGVISLATLFPIGLLRMHRAVNDVRGTVLARSAADEVRVRNLVAPPLGPWFYDDGTANGQGPVGSSVQGTYSPLSAEPQGTSVGMLVPFAPYYTGGPPPFRPTTGRGIPVVIDPLWVLHNSSATTPVLSRLGLGDMNKNGTVDFLGAQGFVRVSAGINSMPFASEVFASPDDLVYMDEDSGERQRIIPVQAPLPGATVPPFLTPTYGAPFSGATLYRERRYSWLAIIRKVNAGQAYAPGPNGTSGSPVAELDDRLDNVGSDGIANLPGGGAPLFSSSDDPATDMFTGEPVLAPVGPFDVTIVVFYKRNFNASEPVFTNDLYPVAPTSEPSLTRPVPIFSPVPRTITIGANTYGPYSPNEATLVERSDGIPFPEIPVGSYILDSTYDCSILGMVANPILGPRGGHFYRVQGKSLTLAGTRNILVLTLDQPARTNGSIDPAGYVLTYLRGAVAVFERQIP